MATPALNGPSTASGDATLRKSGRRLRLEEILTLLQADGIVPAAEAEALLRSPSKRMDHPLEIIAEKNWFAASGPRKQLTVDFLVEWLAGKLGVPYMHVDPLKIDLTAVTQTMTNAYAERYRILPVEVTRTALTVATAEPFVRDWADELEKILKLEVKLVFANPVDIRRYLGEFYNLARSMKKAQEASKGAMSLARDFEQLVALGAQGKLDANDSHVVHIVDWLWEYAFDIVCVTAVRSIFSGSTCRYGTPSLPASHSTSHSSVSVACGGSADFHF